MISPILECAGLSKTYGNIKVLESISLLVNAGEMLTLFGPSGCGKTTLLRCIAGLTPSSQGTIILNGRDITMWTAEKRPIVMNFQQPLLFPHMTVMENVGYSLKARGIKRSVSERECRAMLERTELAAIAHRYPHELSGGQQQRVSLARALMSQPQVLLLDEPFSSLDPELRSSLRSWVKRFLRESGVTVILVTHDREEAMVMSDRVAIMGKGQILQVGRPDDVYENPATIQVAESFSEGLVVKGSFFVPIGKLKINVCEGSGCGAEITGFVTGKLFKAGQVYYQIRLQDSEKELVMPANPNIEINRQVTVTYNEVDLRRLL